MATVGEKVQQKLKEIMGLVTQLKNQKRNEKNLSPTRTRGRVYWKRQKSKSYEFVVKPNTIVSHQKSLILGTNNLPPNPCDEHTLNEQLKQSTILMQEINLGIKKLYGDLAYRLKRTDEHLVPKGL